MHLVADVMLFTILFRSFSSIYHLFFFLWTMSLIQKHVLS